MSRSEATEQTGTSRTQALRPRGLIKAIISAALLAIILLVVFRQAGAEALSNTALGISAGPLALSFGALMLGVLLAAARVKLIAGDLGYRLAWRDALAALGLGQLGGAAFFQLAGLLIARGAYLSRRGVPVGASVVMVGYERLLALGVSLLLATIGAWHLFSRIAIDFQAGGSTFVKLMAGLVLATVAGAVFGWGRAAASRIEVRPGGAVTWRVSRSALLSLFIQLTTALAYVALAHALAPHISVIDLVAAIFVVMLAAALPISFAGWGVREFSAVLALGTVGVPPAAALVTAALIGIGSLIAVVPLAGLALTGRSSPPPSPAVKTPINYNELISMAVPLATATAVFFQVHLPAGEGHFNVNLADPLAILGGVFFLVVHVAGRRALPRWRLDGFNLHVLLTVLVMTAALLIGAHRIGWTEWALANKYMGWFVLLAYGATGALIVAAAGPEGLRMQLSTFAAAGIALAVLDLVLLTARSAGVDVPLEVLWHNPYGFAQNRNAFAFQMLMVFAAAVALGLPRTLSTVALAIVLASLWVTGSRAGYGAVLVVCAVALCTRISTPKQIIAALAGALGIVVAIIAVELAVDLVRLILSKTADFSIRNTYIAGLSFPEDQSSMERFRSILSGIELFRAHPVLGAGLGAFMESEIQSGRPPLVVHSTPVWLLGEMGLVGLIVMAAPVLRIFRREIGRPGPDVSARLLVMMISAFAVMSLVHELLYQRTFWLLLGAALACPFAPRRGDRPGGGLPATDNPE